MRRVQSVSASYNFWCCEDWDVVDSGVCERLTKTSVADKPSHLFRAPLSESISLFLSEALFTLQ